MAKQTNNTTRTVEIAVSKLHGYPEQHIDNAIAAIVKNKPCNVSQLAGKIREQLNRVGATDVSDTKIAADLRYQQYRGNIPASGNVTVANHKPRGLRSAAAAIAAAMWMKPAKPAKAKASKPASKPAKPANDATDNG